MITVRQGPWRAEYHGGRLADIFHDSNPVEAVDCIQAGPYDWVAGKSGANRSTLRAAFHSWLREDAVTYLREVIAYR